MSIATPQDSADVDRIISQVEAAVPGMLEVLSQFPENLANRPTSI